MGLFSDVTNKFDELKGMAKGMLRERITNKAIEKFAMSTAPRPRRWSMAHNYTSWLGLTDRTYTGRHLDEDPEFDTRKKPSIEELKTLFTRPKDTFYPSEDTSVLFLFFAQWLTDSFLRTDFKDIKRTDSNHEIDMCALYGVNEYKTNMLRGEGDKAHLLDSVGDGSDEFPPSLYHTENGEAVKTKLGKDGEHFAYRDRYIQRADLEGWQSMTRYLHAPERMVRITEDQTPKQVGCYYAMGLEHGNGTLGYVVLNILMMRAHNRIAEEIRAAYCPGKKEDGQWTPGWDLDRVFHTARNVLTVILLKITVEDYVGHVANFNLKTPIGMADGARWGKSNHIAIEFNLLYRWHSLVPDDLIVDGKPLDAKQYLRNPSLVKDRGVGYLLTEFSKQRAGRMSLRNHPWFFSVGRNGKPSTMDRTLEGIMRKSRLKTFNQYRVHYGLSPYRSIRDMVGNQPDAETLVRDLEDMYDDIKDVEWFVGLFAEKHVKGRMMGELMLTMVANDAFTQALTNPLLSKAIYDGHKDENGKTNDVTFSDVGRRIMEDISTLQGLADYALEDSEPATCSFSVSKTNAPVPGAGV